MEALSPRRSFFRILAAMLWVLALSAEWVRAADAPHRVSTAYTTIGGIVTPVWLAYEKGIFQKQGLEVTMKYVSSGPVVVSAVLAG